MGALAMVLFLLGLTIMPVGLLAIVRGRLRFLHIGRRIVGAGVCTGGVVLFIAGAEIYGSSPDFIANVSATATAQAAITATATAVPPQGKSLAITRPAATPTARPATAAAQPPSPMATAPTATVEPAAVTATAVPATATAAPTEIPAPHHAVTLVATATAPPASPTPALSATATSSPSLAASFVTHDPSCRSDPHADIYHPDRLIVRQPCVQVEGVVATVRHEADGDYHVNLRLPATEAGLLDDRNVSGEHDELVVEVVPADQAGCTPGQAPRPATGSYDYGTCTGADVAIPQVGDAVQVVGPYVLDADHGWMEVHPAWSITVLSGTATAPVPAIRAVATVPPAASNGDGHTYYASTYRTADTIYCDDDPGWRRLSPQYLERFASLAAAEAALPRYHLHRAC